MSELQESMEVINDRIKRMQWWREARFGMFVHWGLYSQLGRHEWVMNRERIPVEEYEKLADTWKVKPQPAREWARLAKEAGMKYMVMTTKHHEGFCLWDSKQTDYNSVKMGCHRDLVQEYVDACREFGLKVGFYYSLMDWHHPDGANCATDEEARKRFINFTYNCVEELCSNYGQIDILWYDVSWPLKTPELWESAKLNAMVRRLQPQIIINNRSQLPEDFSTPEENIKAADKGRAWEACMTFNGAWGYNPYTLDEDWLSERKVLEMLYSASSEQGNLLLNIGPKPDGSVPKQAYPRLEKVGMFLKENGEAVYGEMDRKENLDWNPLGWWTVKGQTAYFWCKHWPGRTFTFGGFTSKLKKASFLASGEQIAFCQTEKRLVLQNLPEQQPGQVCHRCIVLEILEIKNG